MTPETLQSRDDVGDSAPYMRCVFMIERRRSVVGLLPEDLAIANDDSDVAKFNDVRSRLSKAAAADDFLKENAGSAAPLAPYADPERVLRAPSNKEEVDDLMQTIGDALATTSFARLR